jgi:hypothetical protein
MTALRRSAVAVAALLAACAQAPVPTEQPGSFGILDSAYDRAEWRWVDNPDGRKLLENTRIAKCFVDPDPDTDFDEPGFVVERSQKAIGAARYDVTDVREGRDFWIATYRREGAQTPALGVYAEGRCRDAAEKILRAYEKNPR